jgi:hypothetical protein
VYDVFRIPWLPIRAPESFAAWHSQQGFSFAISAGSGQRQRRTQTFFVGVTNNGDDLIERFAGFRIGYQNVRLGTDRLGLGFSYSSFRNQWSVHTVSPDLYRRRRNFEASVAAAFNANLHVKAGISASELEMLAPAAGFEPSRAGIAAIEYQRDIEGESGTHRIEAAYEVHAGSNSLESDFVYTRHAWNGRYVFQRERHLVRVLAMAGRITGDAPMFERFSLGNSRTLRGYNKYDFAPLGGDRLVYGSLDYSFRKFRLFYDAGALWDSGEEVKIRPSVGAGIGDGEKDDFFLGVAIPLGEPGMTPTFMVVGRFSTF